MTPIQRSRRPLRLNAKQEAELEEAKRNGYCKIGRGGNHVVADVYWHHCQASSLPYVRIWGEVSVDMFSTHFMELTEAAQDACRKTLVAMSKRRALATYGSIVVSSRCIKPEFLEAAARRLWEIASDPKSQVPEGSRLPEDVLGPNR